MINFNIGPAKPPLKLAYLLKTYNPLKEIFNCAVKQTFCELDISPKDLQKGSVLSEHSVLMSDEDIENYSILNPTFARLEVKMTLTSFNSYVDSLKEGKLSQFTSLKSYISDYSYSYEGKRIYYEKVFSSPIFGANHFFYPYADVRVKAIFDLEQRPLTQILAVKGKDQVMRYLLLSLHEARAAYKSGLSQSIY